MNVLNSIKKCQEHPLYLKLQSELGQLWKLVAQDVYFSWWLIAFLVWISLSVLQNILHQAQILKDYSLQKQYLKNYHPQMKNLELGSSYVMGTPISKSSAQMMMEPLVIEAILYNEIPTKREVLLRHANGRVSSYHIGDYTPSGMKINDIENSSITFEVGGLKKKLFVNQYRNDFLSDKPLKSSNGLFQNLKD